MSAVVWNIIDSERFHAILNDMGQIIWEFVKKIIVQKLQRYLEGGQRGEADVSRGVEDVVKRKRKQRANRKRSSGVRRSFRRSQKELMR